MADEHELHEPDTTSTRRRTKITGSHRFKVEDYSLQKEIGIGNYLESAIFTVGGYDWVIQYYPDGITKERKGYLSFYLELKSDALVKARLNFTMLHHNGTPSTLSNTSPVRTFNGKGSTWGYEAFVERTAFEASDNLKNDRFTIMCTLTVVKPSHVELTETETFIMPPSNIIQQFCQLLETGEGADVTFEVGGKLFKAHKNVLAARSPVFRAQFFGPMNEGGVENIKLENVEAEVFRVFLHFIYSDSVPEFKGDSGECEEVPEFKGEIGECEEEDPSIIYQHLLVIADRYEVDRLKLICESKLCQSIEVKNFATTLTLAEQHNCSQLKASCFKFISSLKILTAIMDTDGFEHLTQSCPSILTKLVKNMSIGK